MKLRDHPAIASKRDFFTVDPRQLKTQPGYNVRDLTTPQARESLDALKRNIIANGVRVPLEVRIQGEDLFVVAGHRRLAAVMEAIAEGHEIEAIPCVPESKEIGEIERTLGLIISNTGEPLTAIEIAEVVRRLLAFGWTKEKVAERLGWKSAQAVTQYVALLGADAETQAFVSSGDISVTEAAKIVKTDGAKAGETLRKAREIAKADGKSKITAKTINKARGEFSPSAKNARILVAAIQKIAREPEHATETATRALEAVGLRVEPIQTAEAA